MEITSNDYAGNTRTLTDKNTGEPVKIGDKATTFRGETVYIDGGKAPQKPSSEGHISTTYGGWFYAGVCNLEWK